MSPFGHYGDCRSCASLAALGAECPPTIRPYPPPPRPLKLLFIGWNPPSPSGGFWARDDDHLLANLSWICRELGWTRSTDAVEFRQQFRHRGLYFIHAVKCVTLARFPSGAARTRILEACARAHLCDELAYLRPGRICLLGDLPLRAARLCCPSLPRQAPLLTGLETSVRVGPEVVPTLITCFPDGYQGPGVQRQRVLEHLRRWLRDAMT